MATFLSFWNAKFPDIWSSTTETVFTVGATTKVGLATALLTNTAVCPAFEGSSLKRDGSGATTPVTSLGGTNVG